MTKAAQTLDSDRAACNSCHLLSPLPSPLLRQPSYVLSSPLLPLCSISRMVMAWDKSEWVCAWPLGLGWMSWFGAFGSVSAPDKVHGWGGGDGSKGMGRQLINTQCPSSSCFHCKNTYRGPPCSEALVLGMCQ